MSRYRLSFVLGLAVASVSAIFFAIGQVSAATVDLGAGATSYGWGYIAHNVSYQTFVASSTELRAFAIDLRGSSYAPKATTGTFRLYQGAVPKHAALPPGCDSTKLWDADPACGDYDLLTYWNVLNGFPTQTGASTTLSIEVLDTQALTPGLTYTLGFYPDGGYVELASAHFAAAQVNCLQDWTGASNLCPYDTMKARYRLTTDTLSYSEVEIVELPPEITNRGVQVGVWELTFPARVECLIGSSTCALTVQYGFPDIGKDLRLYYSSASTTDDYVDRIDPLPDAYLLRASLHPTVRQSAVVDEYMYGLLDHAGASTTVKTYGYTKVYWVEELTAGESGPFASLWDWWRNIFPLSLYYDFKSVSDKYTEATSSALTFNLNQVLVDPAFSADAELLSVAKFRYALTDPLYEKWMLFWEYVIHGCFVLMVVWLLWPQERIELGRTHSVTPPPDNRRDLQLNLRPRQTRHGTEVIDLRRT